LKIGASDNFTNKVLKRKKIDYPQKHKRISGKKLLRNNTQAYLWSMPMNTSKEINCGHEK